MGGEYIDLVNPYLMGDSYLGNLPSRAFLIYAVDVLNYKFESYRFDLLYYAVCRNPLVYGKPPLLLTALKL